MRADEAVSVLEKVSARVGERPDGLAVTVAARSGDPFHVLVATVLSLRARDEVVAVIAPKLIEAAPTPEAMASMRIEEIERLIRSGSFYKTKAKHLREMAQVLVDKHGGRVPETVEGLVSLKGVGRKSANLVLNLGFGKDAVCVDVHVHRISNRLGFVSTRKPAETERALEALLPREWWIPINGALIAFGKTVCLPSRPRCGECPVRGSCERNGVDAAVPSGDGRGQVLRGECGKARGEPQKASSGRAGLHPGQDG